jgi:hypothetical protein
VGFPRDCGPIKLVGSQWATLTGSASTGQSDVAWFVETKPPASTTVPGVPLRARDTQLDCIGCVGTAEQLGIKGSSFTVTAWLSVPSWRDAMADPASGAGNLRFVLLSSTEDGIQSRLFLGLDDAGLPLMSFGTNRQPCRPEKDSYTGLQSMVWTHITWRYDVGLQQMAMFVNGAEIARCSGRLPFRGEAHDVVLGSHIDNGVFAGHMRSIKIADTHLTDDQIADEVGLQRRPAWEWYNVRDAKCWRRSSSCVGSPRRSQSQRKRAQVAVLPSSYTYDLARTPTVTNISRLTGTTAGGTSITLTGQGLGTDPEVRLRGVKCATARADIGSYRGMHLCDWGDMQREQGKTEVAVNCSGLGATPMQCAALNTSDSIKVAACAAGGQPTPVHRARAACERADGVVACTTQRVFDV